MRLLRIFLLTLLLAAFSSVVAFAERPEVSADHQSFDVATMRYLLDGNVTVRFKDRIITADHAQVSLATLEVWAQDHIRAAPLPFAPMKRSSTGIRKSPISPARFSLNKRIQRASSSTSATTSSPAKFC